MKIFSLQDEGYFNKRPAEDSISFDAQRGVFAVADGVGLWEGIEYVGNYPRISGSAKLSRAFSRTFVQYIARHPRASVLDGFRAGNVAAGKVNAGRSKYDVFRKHNGLFAATAAMAIVRDTVLHWGNICDAGVAVIDSKGNLKLRKENCGNSFSWPKDIKSYEASTWTLFFRTLARNGVDRNGKLQGYGVVTGEPEAEFFLETGVYKLRRGDTVLVYSDGFSPYISFAPFRKMLAGAESERVFREGAEKIATVKTARFEKMLRGKYIDQLKSVEVIGTQLQKFLGKHYSDVEWVKERSLIVVKV
jgi:hypothetical protein